MPSMKFSLSTSKPHDVESGGLPHDPAFSKSFRGAARHEALALLEA